MSVALYLTAGVLLAAAVLFAFQAMSTGALGVAYGLPFLFGGVFAAAVLAGIGYLCDAADRNRRA